MTPQGSKVAVWAVMGIDEKNLATAHGILRQNCPFCLKTAAQLGIDTEGPGVNPPPQNRLPTPNELEIYNGKLRHLKASTLPKKNTQMTMIQIVEWIKLVESGLSGDSDEDFLAGDT